MATEGPSENHKHKHLENCKLLNPYIDSSDFEMVSKSPAFVDKTMLIKEFLRNPSTYILITAPSGFGKSTNLDMIKRFSELNIDKTTGKIGASKKSVNYKLFTKSRLISREKDFINKYFGQYAVIHLSLKDVHGNNMESLIETYSQALSKTFSEHKYLLNSNQITVEEKKLFSDYISNESNNKLSQLELEIGIGYLARLLSKHCKKYQIIAFVDDYDVAFAEFLAWTNISSNGRKKIAIFFKNIYENIMVVKNDIIHRVLISGVTTLAWTYISPKNVPILLERFLYYGFFSDYYGLTKKEIAALLYKFAIDIAHIKPIITHYGYISLQSNTIVSTRSLMYYLNSKVFNDYYDYPRIAETIGLRTRICIKEIRYIIEKTLLDVPYGYEHYDESILFELKLFRSQYSKDSWWPFAFLYTEILSEFGFCYIGKQNIGNSVFRLIIVVNEHVRSLFKKEIEHFYSTRVNNLLILCAEHLNRLSISSDGDYFSKFAEILKKIYTFSDIGDADITNKKIYYPFIAILGKSEYYSTHSFFEGFEGLFIRNRETLVVCIISHLSNDNVKEKGMVETLEKTLTHPEFGSSVPFPENKIYMGITFNKTFDFSFGIIKNSKKMGDANFVL